MPEQLKLLHLLQYLNLLINKNIQNLVNSKVLLLKITTMKKIIIVNKQRYRLDRLDFTGYLKLFPKGNEKEFEKLTGKKIEKPIEIKKDAGTKENKKPTKKTDKKNSD